MIAALLAGSTAAHAWPADDAWTALERDAWVMVDSDTDGTSDLPALELIGGDLDPLAFWAADMDGLHFRIRVAGSPSAGADTLIDGTWGLLIDTNGGTVAELAVLVQGAPGTLRVWPNADGTAGTQLPFVSYGSPVPIGDLASDHVRVVAASSGSAFVDLTVPLDVLAAVGVTGTQGLQVVPVVGPSPYLPWTDIGGCSEPIGQCDQLSDARSEAFQYDVDLDGIPDAVEDELDLGILDSDSDDDGTPDGVEGLGDSDGDGVIDALDCDSDNDGVLDSVERGLVVAGPDTDVAANCFVPDADPATTTDPTVADTDGGGLGDRAEDFNGNGRLDPFETDPGLAADDTDTDGDGIADVLELLGADGLIDDDDSDGDTLPDAGEGLADPDGDGIPAFLDDDSDGDGLLDGDETLADRDNDGRPNAQDTDSDGDGIPDAVEGFVDSDGDGQDDLLDTDSDGDGVQDRFEGDDDFDGDGVPDYLDLDSDDDGLSDEVEGSDDTDDDGARDINDLDSDNDGLTDAYEGDDDPDLDGVPNFQDRNSDGQGAIDGTEGTGDQDCDGIEDWEDTDEEDSFCDPPQPTPGVDPEPPPERPEGDPDFGAGDFTGGSCSTAPAGAGWLVLGLVLTALRRRSAVLAGLLTASGALAQDIDAARFRPSADSVRFVGVEDLDLAPAGAATFGAWMGHAVAPLVFRPDGGLPEMPLLGAVTTAELSAAWSAGAARLALSAPLHVRAVGTGFEGPVRTGDLRVSAKVRLIDIVHEGIALPAPGEPPVLRTWFRVGVLLEATLPTGSPAAWLGAGRTRFAGAVLSEWKPREGLVLAANVGARSATGAQLGSLVVGPALEVGLGGVVRLHGETWLGLELDGEQWFGNTAEPGSLPVEWLGTLRQHFAGNDPLVRVRGPWSVLLGAGTGIGRGVGAPDVRVVGGLRYSPRRRVLVDRLRES